MKGKFYFWFMAKKQALFSGLIISVIRTPMAAQADTTRNEGYSRIYKT